MFLIAPVAVLLACGGSGEPAAATQTSVVISAAEEDPRQPVVVRSLAIDPDTVRPGQQATVRVELEAARPRQQVSLDWYGPDGWLVAYETRDAAATRLDFNAPARSFDRPGRYRAVLRVGRRPLAEDTVTVTG
jgi:hypothetical protein